MDVRETLTERVDVLEIDDVGDCVFVCFMLGVGLPDDVDVRDLVGVRVVEIDDVVVREDDDDFVAIVVGEFDLEDDAEFVTNAVKDELFVLDVDLEAIGDKELLVVIVGTPDSEVDGFVDNDSLLLVVIQGLGVVVKDIRDDRVDVTDAVIVLDKDELTEEDLEDVPDLVDVAEDDEDLVKVVDLVLVREVTDVFDGMEESVTTSEVFGVLVAEGDLVVVLVEVAVLVSYDKESNNCLL